MHARVSTYQFDAADVDDAIRSFENAIGQVQSMEGGQGGVFLFDRQSGKAISITYWESEDAVRASAEAADRVRGQATEAARGSIQSVETYEVGSQF